MKNKEKLIGSVIILVIFSIFLFIGYNITNSKSSKDKNQDIFVAEDSSATNAAASDTNVKNPVKPISANTKIRVEIKGAVKTPDVYTLEPGSIVLDLVKASGGYNADADKDSIIQSTKLNDGDCIWVKKKGEVSTSLSGVATISAQSTNVNAKVNINTATKEQLMKLDGIGDSRADKIIEYREKNGPFKSLEDLKKAGARIGDATLKNIKNKADIK